jgi:hypothetical protein
VLRPGQRPGLRSSPSAPVSRLGVFARVVGGYHRAIDASVFIWMFFVLKIPIVAALWIIWWAIQDPDAEVAEDRGDGGNDRDPGSHPRRPRPPRRGPHASPPPAPPQRVRTVAGRRLTKR